MGSLIVRYEEIDNSRPRKGWSIYFQSPKGIESLRTKRNRLKRFSSLDRVLLWAAKEYPGCDLRIEGSGYEGLLSRTD